jgi:hypothetical protein
LGANPPALAPNWWPCRLALPPIVPPTPTDAQKCVQTFPCPKSILGGTPLPYKVGHPVGRPTGDPVEHRDPQSPSKDTAYLAMSDGQLAGPEEVGRDLVAHPPCPAVGR